MALAINNFIRRFGKRTKRVGVGLPPLRIQVSEQQSFMDDKKAINILLNLLKRLPLNKEEKEAVHNAIGILSWASLSKSRIKAIKNKRDKSINE